MLAGILMGGVALIGLGSMTALWMFYLFYLFNALGYVCAGPLPNQVLLTRWFDKARGRAMGFAYLGIGLGIVIVYLAMSINVYLESTVFGVFKISYGRIGPTEVRLILILLNTAAIITAGWPSPLPVPISVIANWMLGAILIGMVALFVGRFARNLTRLAKLEPQRFRWWE